MKTWRTWRCWTNFRVPGPLAAALLILVALGAFAWVFIDWSTAHLPPPGAPGRHDWAISKYYKSWRLRQEAQEERWFREHPEYARYRGLPPEEIRLRIEAEKGRR